MQRLDADDFGDIPESLGQACQQDRLANAYLMYGRNPAEFTETITKFFQGILCTGTPESLEACGTCRDCLLTKKLTHPDVVAPGAPGGSDDLGEDDRFGVDTVRERILEPSSLTPARSTHKLFWLHDISRFTTEASNCLLKVLEEPPGDTVFILTSRSRWDCLPTIRSRCQWIRMQPERASYDSFIEKCRKSLTQELDNEQLLYDWLELLKGKSRSHQFNWSRTTSRQFLEFLLILINDHYTDGHIEEIEGTVPEERLSYRVVPDILDRFNELERGGNPSVVVNSMLEELFYPEESNEWLNVT